MKVILLCAKQGYCILLQGISFKTFKTLGPACTTFCGKSTDVKSLGEEGRKGWIKERPIYDNGSNRVLLQSCQKT